MAGNKLGRPWKCRLCGWPNVSTSHKCAGCEKPKPRKKPKPLAPMTAPWDCVILALDAAATTGWSIWSRGLLLGHGELKIWTADGQPEAARITLRCREIAYDHRVPWCVWAERSWGGRMGKVEPSSVGYWRCCAMAEQLPRSRFGTVYPGTWRGATLPKGHAKDREGVRAAEQARARELWGDGIGEDEAPAMLIGLWATRAAETGALLPARHRKAVGA